VAGLGLAACGDDDAAESPGGGGNGGNGGNGGDASDADSAPGGGGGSGSGTFTVDGKTLEVEVFFCGFGPEETQNDNVPFSFRASGVEDGKNFTLDGAVIGDTMDDPAGGNLDMWYDEDPTTVVYAPGISFDGSGGPGWQFDGDNARFEDEYENADGESVGPGVFEGTCP